MAFTYNAVSPTASPLSHARFLIGDVTEGAGILPNGGNFTDADLGVWLTKTASDPEKAAILALRNCAIRWATTPNSFSADGMSVNRGDMAQKMNDAANLLEASIEAAGAPAGTGLMTFHEVSSVL